ncbi:MAG: alpha/beta hydrolase [Pseudomonadota bacterium]|nr:alpha/beta hydrolase [Pseudomonadota bacterium]
MPAFALDSLLNRHFGGDDTADWPEGTRMFATRFGRIRVFDSGGKGPVMLMVPDGPNVIEHHLPVIEALRAHARVICFDLPGFGHSQPAVAYRHRLQDGAAVVLAVMDALDVREAALHFSCSNGLYAIAIAKLAPQRIRRLLLCQTPSMQAMREWIPRNVPKPLQIPVVGQLLMRGARRRFAKVWYDIALPEPATRPAFLHTADHALTHGGCFCLASVVQGLSGAQEAELRGVTQPVTMLWGDRDRSHRRTRAESLLDLLPQTEIIHFPECGHFPDLEQPQRYVELALATLNS